MKLSFNRKSIFIQLTTIFFLVITILFLTSYSIYLWGINIIRNEFINETCVQNKNFSDNLNNEFKRIIMLQYGIVDDWDLKKLSTLSSEYNTYQQSLMILRLRDKIMNIKSSSKLIEKIGIIIPQVNTLISTSVIDNICEDTINQYTGYAKMSQEKIVYTNDKLILISGYPEYYYYTSTSPNFIIYTEISKSAMQKFLDNMSNYKESNEFVLSEKRDMVIANNKDNNITNKIRDLIVNQKGEKINSGNLQMEDTYLLKEDINGQGYIIVYSDTGLSDIKLVRYISEKSAFSGLKAYNIIMWLFAIVALITMLIFSNSLYKKIHSPLKKLVKAFDSVKKANLSISIKHKSDDEFKYIYDSFNDMVLQLKTLIDEVYKEKLLVEKANLKQLQAQINPHFLYNSFLILQNRIALEDTEFAQEFCRELGLYFMFITKNKQDEVPLKYEVEHAVIYAKIQHARFYSRLEMKIEELPKQCEDIMVPRLILQPILENAFEHSLENMESGGFLHMGYCLKRDYLDIIIENNGEEIKDSDIEIMQKNLNNNKIEATGMINIHQRLKLIYSDGYGLLLTRSEYGGLKVTVRIPSENSEEFKDV